MTGHVSKSCLYTYGMYRMYQFSQLFIACSDSAIKRMRSDTQYHSSICMIYFHYCITPSKN